MQHLTPSARKAIAALRDLVALAVADVEAKLGGPLTLEAQAALRAWLARAFEVGRVHTSEEPHATNNITQYLNKRAELHAADHPAARAALLETVNALWDRLTDAERAYILKTPTTRKNTRR